MPTGVLADFPSIYKRRYPEYEIERLTLQGNPLLSLVPKDTDFDGEEYREVLQFTDGAGVSGNYGPARANRRPDRYGHFTLARADIFSDNSLGVHAMLSAQKKGPGALVKLLTRTIDSMTRKASRQTNIHLYGNGGGSFGQIATGGIDPGRTLITLADTFSATNFEIDMVLEFSTDNGTGGAGVRAIPSVRITNVDPDNGILTVTPALDAAVTALDFIFNQGNYNNVIMGLAGYVPPSPPGTGGIPGTLFGLDRTQHTDRLGGIRFDGTNRNLR